MALLLRHGPRSFVILTGAVTLLPPGTHHSTTSAITTPGTAIRTVRVSAVAVAAFAHHFRVHHAEAHMAPSPESHSQIGVNLTYSKQVIQTLLSQPGFGTRNFLQIPFSLLISRHSFPLPLRRLTIMII